MKQEIEELLERAEALLGQAESGEVEALLSGVEQYAKQFGEWFGQHESAIVSGQAAEHQVQLEKLSEQHGRVIALAEQLMENTSADRRQLKQKGKAIMSYLDVFPKRITVAGTRKG